LNGSRTHIATQNENARQKQTLSERKKNELVKSN